MKQTFEQFDILNGDTAAFDESGNAPQKYGLAANTRIVRYISAERYLKMIETVSGDGDGKVCGYNELSLVTRWDDPYEACLLRATGASGSSDGMKGLCESIQDYYGQCWMLKWPDGEKVAGKKEDGTFESDVVWRAYCPNRDGVRIETTVGDLVTSIKKCLPEVGDDAKDGNVSASDALQCRIGRVIYDLDALEKMQNRCSRDADRPDDVEDAIVSSLFVKRKEFSDEREVRVLLKASPEFVISCNSKANGGISFEQGGCRMRDIGFIKGVLVDPRMPRHRAEEILCRTRIALNMKNDSENGKEIGRSTLYEWPEFTKAMKKIGRMANVNYELWAELQKKYPHGGTIDLKNRSVPTKSYWTGLPCGESGCCFAFTCCRTVARVELYLGKKKKAENKRLFVQLKAQEDAIKRQLRIEGVNAEDIAFDELESKIGSRIYVKYGNVISNDSPKKRDDIVKWFCVVMPSFAKAMTEALAKVKMAKCVVM